MKNKNVLLLVAIIVAGLLISGGTYAFLAVNATVTNGTYQSTSTCFVVDYNINNVDNSQTITGTLFASGTIGKGLTGRVGLKVNASCSVDGIGSLILHINGNNSTSSTLTSIATSHCENKKTGETISNYTTESACTTGGGSWKSYPTSYCENRYTLEYMKDYTSQGDCTSNNGVWTTNGSALKYAIYNNSSASGNPLIAGHFSSSDIGNDKTLYNNISITSTQSYYYIYIWLDGYLTDNSFTNLSFSGVISAEATQVE